MKVKEFSNWCGVRGQRGAGDWVMTRLSDSSVYVVSTLPGKQIQMIHFSKVIKSHSSMSGLFSL